MSMEILVFLTRARLPSVEAWQAAITEAGFPVILDTGFDPVEHRGFLPCELRGKESGFEYTLRPSREFGEYYPDLVETIGRYDAAAVFTWGGSLEECAVALTAAAALAVAGSGVVYDPQEGMAFDATGALQYARDTYAFLPGAP